MQLTLDIYQAEKKRDEGIERAKNHAEAVEPGWNERADQMFKEWLQGWPQGYKFLIEDFRMSASIRGLPEPPSNRAFGGMALRARKAELIKSVGLAATTSKKGHRCFASVWIKL